MVFDRNQKDDAQKPPPLALFLLCFYYKESNTAIPGTMVVVLSDRRTLKVGRSFSLPFGRLVGLLVIVENSEWGKTARPSHK